jgi:hypothetical protein
MSGCRSRRCCTGLGKGRVSWIALHAPPRPARPRSRWFCISQRPGHGVAVAALTSTSRAPWIAGHRRAEDRRHLLVDRGVGDGHAQLDRAHDRVGNNRRRERSSLRHGSPRWRGGRVSATRIVTHRGPTSSKRHGPRTRISANHPCTLIQQEPANGSSTNPGRTRHYHVPPLAARTMARRGVFVSKTAWPCSSCCGFLALR